MDTCSETCPICLDDIKEDHICKELSCGHKFHFICFNFGIIKARQACGLALAACSL